MKRLVIVLVILFCGCAGNPWRQEDTLRQTAFVGITTIDWMQTRQIADNPNKFYETNPILGRHPSKNEINLYFAGSVLAHTAIAAALPHGWRDWWQSLAIGLETGVVAHNASIGIRVGF